MAEIARNLITTPDFPDETHHGAWQGIDNIEFREGADGNRAGGARMTISTAMPAEDGQQYRLQILAYAPGVLSGDGPIFALRVADSQTSTNPGDWDKNVGYIVSPDGGNEYTDYDVTFTLDKDEIWHGLGGTVPPSEWGTVTLEIISRASTAQHHIGFRRVRLSLIDGEPDTLGYFDGDSAETTDGDGNAVTFSWAGTPWDSESVATADVPDPDPEDPDPEDPDPEDPDPEDPDPEDPDPDDALAGLVDELAPRVAAHAGHRDDEDMTELARDVLPVVVEFVGGYVRDRGMGSSGYAPERQLRAVIVSAASRLVLNPDQVRQYSTADYSETSPVFSGYSLAEIGVLHRYRKRWA